LPLDVLPFIFTTLARKKETDIEKTNVKRVGEKKWQNDERSQLLAKCRKMSGSEFLHHQHDRESERWGHVFGQWVEIAEFPGYSVSDTGQVRNDDTRRLLSKLSNQGGVVHVGMVRDGVLCKRSLPLLVANAFLEKPDPKRFSGFDTPVNLDGNRFNTHVGNLMWRPRWFAIKYFRQFQQEISSICDPVENIDTGVAFSSSWEAATTLGVLDREIALSVMSKNYVWPIFQRFRLLH
jgi:hypothetical protein